MSILISDIPTKEPYDEHVEIYDYNIPKRQFSHGNKLLKESFSELPPATSPSAAILSGISNSYVSFKLDKSIHYVKSAYLNFTISNTSATGCTTAVYTIVPTLDSTGAATATAGGSLSIGIGRYGQTLPLAYNTTAANWQIAIRALDHSNSDLASITVAGTLDATGMTITLTGVRPYMDKYGPVYCASNSLVSAVPNHLMTVVTNSVAFSYGDTFLLTASPLLIQKIESFLGNQQLEKKTGEDSFIDIFSSEFDENELLTICTKCLYINPETLQSVAYIEAGGSLNFSIPINNSIVTSNIPFGLLPNVNPELKVYFSGGAANILQTLTGSGAVIADVSLSNISLTIGGTVLDRDEFARKKASMDKIIHQGVDFRCLLATSVDLQGLTYVAGATSTQVLNQNADVSHMYIYSLPNTITAGEQRYAFLELSDLNIVSQSQVGLMSGNQLPQRIIRVIACQKFQSRVFEKLNVYALSPSTEPLKDLERGEKWGGLKIYSSDCLKVNPAFSAAAHISVLIYGFATICVYANGSVVIERSM